jgi:hypothetical protein
MGLNLYNDAERGVQSLSNTPIRTIEIDLSATTSAKNFDLSGQCFYIDINSTGTALIDLASLSSGVNDKLNPIPVGGGSYVRIPFQSLKISWQAQPNAKLILLVGDFYIRPSTRYLSPVQSTGINTISGTEISQYGTNTGVLSLVANVATLNPAPIFNATDFDVAEIDTVNFITHFFQPSGSALCPNQAVFSTSNGTLLNAIANVEVMQAIIMGVNVFFYVRGLITLPKPIIITKNKANPQPTLGVAVQLFDPATTIFNSSVSWNGRHRKA